MKNRMLYLLTSKVNINVKGICIERFIKRLYTNKIDILNIIYLSDNEVNIKIYKKDYDKVLKLKTIYDICIIDYSGVYKVRQNIKYNKYIIVFLIFSLSIIYILSNMIFSIEILTNDESVEKVLYEELNKQGIKKYNFKKSYNELLKIKSNILNKYKDKIEWIEIESIGTKYIVKYEPRVIKKDEDKTNIRDIVAKKDSVIYSMNVENGMIIKGVNSYVKKGEVIVSGSIMLNEEVKEYVSSKGEIYGEVWYKTSITYPFKYYEEVLTKNKKNVLVLTFFSNEIYFSKTYKFFNKKTYNIIKNNLLPLRLDIKNIQEKEIINETYTEKELINKAIELGKKKIKSKLSENEFIKDFKIINKIKNKENMEFEIFYSVIENIGEYKDIVKEEVE